MAITWTASIQVLNLAESRVKFTGTRLDDSTGEERTYSCTGIVTINAHKRAMEDMVWSQYQEALANEAANAAKIGNWTSEAKTNLEEKE